MSKYVYENGDSLLIQEGEWEIRECTTQAARRYNLDSYIVHHCSALADEKYPATKSRYWWSLAIINTKCDGCHKTPPDDIMGLWKLHNFEYIQSGGNA